MTITDKQIDILESLIVEGIIALTTLPEGKKQYIDRVKKYYEFFVKRIMKVLQTGLNYQYLLCI